MDYAAERSSPAEEFEAAGHGQVHRHLVANASDVGAVLDVALVSDVAWFCDGDRAVRYDILVPSAPPVEVAISSILVSNNLQGKDLSGRTPRLIFGSPQGDGSPSLASAAFEVADGRVLLSGTASDRGSRTVAEVIDVVRWLGRVARSLSIGPHGAYEQVRWPEMRSREWLKAIQDADPFRAELALTLLFASSSRSGTTEEGLCDELWRLVRRGEPHTSLAATVALLNAVSRTEFATWSDAASRRAVRNEFQTEFGWACGLRVRAETESSGAIDVEALETMLRAMESQDGKVFHQVRHAVEALAGRRAGQSGFVPDPRSLTALEKLSAPRHAHHSGAAEAARYRAALASAR